jgi:hypothetical protein
MHLIYFFRFYFITTRIWEDPLVREALFFTYFPQRMMRPLNLFAWFPLFSTFSQSACEEHLLLGLPQQITVSQTGCFKTTEMHSFRVLEARSLKSKYQ